MAKPKGSSKFLSARKIGIPQSAYDGLLWTLAALESGKINGGKKRFRMNCVINPGYDGDDSG